MPRSLPEWIGATPDARVPPRIRKRIWDRQAAGANFVVCPISGAILRTTADAELDHEKALIENGEHRERNLRFVAIAAHREKTKGEVAVKARVDDRAKSHLRINAGLGPLAVPAEVSKARKDARSKDRAGGKLPVPRPRSLFQGVG